MRFSLAAWLRLWRTTPVALESPLPVAAVVARLGAALDSGGQPEGTASAGPLPWVLVGRVEGAEVRLGANSLPTANAWNAVLRAELTALPGGCRLAGVVGWRRWVRVFSAVWLAGVLAFLLAGIAGAAVSLSAGRGTGGYLPMALVPLVMAAFFVGVTWSRGSRGRRDQEGLLQPWLRRTLETR